MGYPLLNVYTHLYKCKHTYNILMSTDSQNKTKIYTTELFWKHVLAIGHAQIFYIAGEYFFYILYKTLKYQWVILVIIVILYVLALNFPNLLCN